MSKKRHVKLLNTKNTAFVLKKGLKIGELDAEYDQWYLENAFVDKEEINNLNDIKDYRCILIGRTGSGKTALLSSIINDENISVNRIQPEAMSLKYLVNSDILNYYEKLDIRVDFFYKILWKHVFIVELLKLYSGSDSDRFKTTLDRIREFILGKGSANKKAEDYLKDWKDSFWLNTDVKIKEMEQTLKNKFLESGSLGLPADLGKLSAEYENTSEERVKKEIRERAQSVINDLQIKDLLDITQVMKDEIFPARKGRYFLIIDDLDKEWVDKKIVYSLIRSMIEAIKELNSIPGIKIIIALRENLLRLVYDKNPERGYQREKYAGMFLPLDWNESELKSLVDKRLDVLFKEQYTGRIARFDDIFKWPIKGYNTAFQYILERSLMRPRDIIDFVNCCILKANGKAEINSEIIKSAETLYSNNRLSALKDEWIENFPLIEEIVSIFIGRNENFNYEDFLNFSKEPITELFINKNNNPKDFGSLHKCILGRPL